MPLIVKPPAAFNVAVDGFSFANYAEPTYTKLTSVEVRRLFGDKACSSAVRQDGSCTLTPAGQRWMENINNFMITGVCEGMSIVSLLMHNGTLNPQDFGAARAIDLAIENNPKLQREIAYWFATTLTNRADTVKSSPNAVLAALRADISTRGSAFGTLRFSKADESGGHSVAPIGLRELGGGTVAIIVYDSNYPGETREISIDTVANTWFYSPEASLTEDDYSGDAEGQTLGYAPIAPRLGVQTCPFCAPEPAQVELNQIQIPTEIQPQIETCGSFLKPCSDIVVIPNLILPIDSSYTSYQGALGTKGNEAHKFFKDLLPLDMSHVFPSANPQSGLAAAPKSWQNPAQGYYAFVPTQTLSLELGLPEGQTNVITSSLSYLGSGFVFEVSEITAPAGTRDTFEVAAGGTQISYTTGSGQVPELYVGFETQAADFGFAFFDFDMLANDSVIMNINVEYSLVEVRVNTSAASGDVIFDFEMTRVNETSEEIFQSPEGGLDLRNGETLLIDYGAWQGGNSSLRVGYDSNENGLLDPDEVFEWQDAP
ncbi:MAG: hypothetical protein EI684_10940 [Candidatus Viridilinea halotolerans]|uniref:Uncharacterized protein n=1 Tax=Candidatus Viridilinea halotolerans TaxID=2491704 RepID=A0A426TZP9_9CHLR|nr:MAG: hypothetical protein EI684_10940 [Candidatus Viridilinea halotolerans]